MKLGGFNPFESMNKVVLIVVGLFVLLVVWFLASSLLIMVALGVLGLFIIMFALKSRTRNKTVQVGALLIGVMLILFGVGQTMLTVTDWESGLTLELDTFSNTIGWGGTHIYDVYVELDDTEYVTAMFSDEEGQKIITVSSYIVGVDEHDFGWGHVVPEYYCYKIFYSTSQDQWTDVSRDSMLTDVSGPICEVQHNWYDVSDLLPQRDLGVKTHHVPLAFSIEGNHVGGIRVSLMIWVLFPDETPPFVLGSKDEAHLHSGYGFVDVTGVVNKDGETIWGGTTGEEEGKVIIHAECGGGAWELRIGKTKSITTSYDTVSLPEGCWQDVYWDIPIGAFTPSGDPLDNQYTAKLFNTVIEQSTDTFFTVDKRDYIPDSADISMTADVSYAIVGEDVTLTFTAKSNSQTNLSIGSFVVWIFYGQYRPGTQFEEEWIADNEVLKDVSEISNDTYQATYTFKAHKEGTITAEIVAVDSEGRASDVVAIKMNVFWDEDDVGFFDKLGLDLTWIIIIIIVLLGIILAYYFLKKRRK